MVSSSKSTETSSCSVSSFNTAAMLLVLSMEFIKKVLNVADNVEGDREND